MKFIPKVFHQIWINNDNPDLPKKYAEYRDTWLNAHPDWEYRLWNLNNLSFESRFTKQLAQCSNYAQMADILRYEILYELGGVYIDIDFDCQKSIEPLLEDVKNFSCSEDGRTISIGIIGAEIHSSLMLQCLNEMPEQIGLTVPTIETGPGFFTKVILGLGFNNNLTLFPTEWFYPYGWKEHHRASECFPNAYAVHRWAGSWVDDHLSLKRRMIRKIRSFFIRSK